MLTAVSWFTTIALCNQHLYHESHSLKIYWNFMKCQIIITLNLHREYICHLYEIPAY